jgi:hypothetical protein
MKAPADEQLAVLARVLDWAATLGVAALLVELTRLD